MTPADKAKHSRESRTFLWGMATSAYQVEGGILNCDWAEAAREGKVPKAGRACDHYNRFESDFDIAASLGANAERISLEWARIEPEEGKFDEAAVVHYRKVLEALRRRNLIPMVTAWHFSLPLWFSRRGGFLQKDAENIFARYCRFVAERLGGHAGLWLTMNEPMVYASAGYMKGAWPPFRKNPIAFLRAVRALLRAHRASYAAMKAARPSIKVGIAKNNVFFESDINPLNIAMRACADWFWNHRFLRKLEGCQDFIGLNHYRHHKFGASKEERAAAVYSDTGWEVHPASLYRCLAALKSYGIPIYVTEHGIADAADTRRAGFLRLAFLSLRRAREEGVDVRGYFYWSLLDNYEWAEGFSKRFGLVAVNYDTLERTVRASASVFAEQARTNSL